MTKDELVRAWEEYRPVAAIVADSVPIDGEADVSTEIGAAIVLGEAILGWKKGDVVVFWRGGKATELPEKFHFMNFVY